STDKSREIVRSYSETDERIQVIELEENKGVGEARNIGLNKARGNLIAFIDSDDCWYPEKLERQVRFMQEGNYAISFTAYEMMDKEGNPMDRVVHAIDRVSLHVYLKSTIIGFSTSMINREITGEFYISNLRLRVDTQLWIRLLKKGFTAHGLDEVLMKYRVHPRSISRNKYKTARQTWNLYFNIEKLGFFHSVYYFSHYAMSALKKHYF
ncbi:MAG: glycosyltransferase family 2 protein, partial [Bacteroidota bacterium]|nr:glycosyltransferase family 2 protein [Bacteroidota bacterium]